MRNKLLSLGAVFVVMLVSFFFLILDVSSYIVDKNIEHVGKNVDFTIFLAQEVNVDNPLAIELQKELEALPATLEVVSKERALKEMETSMLPAMVDFVKTYRDGNVLPASIIVKDVSGQDPKKLLSVISQKKYETVIDMYSDQSFFQEQIGRLSNFMNILTSSKVMFFFLYLFFTAIAALIIFNTQRILIHTRKSEIQVMELVGAKNQFIQLPFFFESALLSLAGIGLGCTLFLLLTFQGMSALALGAHNVTLPAEIIVKTLFTHVFEFLKMSWWFEGFKLIAIFILISCVSTFIALRRYLPRL